MRLKIILKKNFEFFEKKVLTKWGACGSIFRLSAGDRGRRTGTLKNEQQKQKGKTTRCREAVRRKNLCEPEILRKRFLRRERRDDSKVRERKSAR